MVVRVLDFMFLLEARPPPLVPFFGDDSPDNLSFLPFSIFFLFIFFLLLGHCDCDLLGDELADEFGVHAHLPVEFHGCLFHGLGDGLSFFEFCHSFV